MPLQPTADVAYILEHARYIQPLILFLLALTVIFLMLSSRFVVERLSFEVVSVNMRAVKIYLCILILAHTLIIFMWYLDTFIINLPFMLFPFALILLITGLSFSLRLTLFAFVSLVIAVTYYLLEPRYQLFTNNLNAFFLQLYSLSSLAVSALLGILLRQYQQDLGFRIDELRETNWRTSERLAEKTQEEATLRLIYKGSLVVGSSELSQQSVMKNVVRETQQLVKAACIGILLRSAANEISCSLHKDRFARDSEEREIVAFITDVIAIEKLQLKRATIISIPKVITQKYRKRLGRQFVSMLFVPLSVADAFGFLFLLRASTDDDFHDKDLHKLTLFAAYASLAIRNAQHHEDLERLVRARDQFASAIAHELNTPLTTIKLYAQLQLQKMKDAHQAGDIKKTLTTIDQEVDRLSSLIRSLVDFAHMQSGKVKLEKKQFSLRKSCKDRIDVLHNLHPEQKFTFYSSIRRAPFFGDQIRLEQVMTNLLNNAVKYSSGQQPIEVKLTKKPDKYVVSIKDYGPGINKQDLEKIFEPFYQAKQPGTSKRIEKGLGLGLYISRSIIELHNGKIWVESEAGKGATFFFSLPIES